MTEYVILFESRQIGTAQVEICGLYFYITCRCDLPKGSRCRITAQGTGEKVDLGLCVPCDKRFGLSKRVPCRQLQGALVFRAESEKSEQEFIPVHPERECLCLSRLRNARFAVANGQLGVVLTAVSPDPPDNDQSRGSGNKWEHPGSGGQGG